MADEGRGGMPRGPRFEDVRGHRAGGRPDAKGPAPSPSGDEGCDPGGGLRQTFRSTNP